MEEIYNACNTCLIKSKKPREDYRTSIFSMDIRLNQVVIMYLMRISGLTILNSFEYSTQYMASALIKIRSTQETSKILLRS